MMDCVDPTMQCTTVPGRTENNHSQLLSLDTITTAKLFFYEEKRNNNPQTAYVTK